MSSTKLTYFDVRGLAEPIRWTLLVSGQKFEDNRLALTDWPARKEEFADSLGEMPVFEFEGVKMTQSSAILRYLANKFNLNGESPQDVFKIDEIVDVVTDLRLLWRKFFLEKDESKKDVEKKTMEEVNFPKYLKFLEGRVGRTEGPFILGSKMAWGDFVVANWVDIWEQHHGENFFNDYPNLKAINVAVFQVPLIKEFVDKRQPMMV